MAEKEIKVKVYHDEVMDDQPLQEPLNYNYILQTPTSLSDINKGEGKDLKAISGSVDDGVWIGDVINEKIDTQSKEILGEFVFADSGAIKIATDNNNGIWLSPAGILGKKGGVPTFTLTASGDATYKGEITASQITAGTLTGFTIQTASTSNRIKIHHDTSYGYGAIDFYDSGGRVARITPVPSVKGVGISLQTEVYGFYPSLNLIDQVSNSEASLLVGNQGLGVSIGSAGNYNWSSQDFIPTSSSLKIGDSYSKWNEIHTNSITLGGVKRTSWTAGISSLSELSIDTSKYWSGYNITGLGDITPYYSSWNNLGSSSYNWQYLYLSDGIYRGSSQYIELNSKGVDLWMPLGLRQYSSPPGSASSYKGFMYWDNSVSKILFSDGSRWHKVSADPIQ